MPDKLLEGLLAGRFIDVGELRVSRTTPDRARGKARYVLYLPLSRNYLWEKLYESRAVVRVYFEVVEGGGSREEQE
ncbi:hypothetical protein DKAM_1123 [Desulfurococcus amylolyticus 1221n]|uniref:Uncharacterized protein n=1 Tax=Desulfurococcus amylolyticus (strain DSM 18924 / JCM 16383 / VKM B-2413 / 1221n) TaxID=490899 RepID=B8D5R8_DESA1|nr:hypothetical protein [Desulfurococcus amylolyticus]ACL11449.1 hypothetical protein DKAM_1123 [Desulfurococcus amylolyticus 1221n]